MFNYKKNLVSLVLAFGLLPVSAQQVSFKASIDSTALLIGQQTRMHLEISGPASLKYAFPVFQGDTLVNGIEVVQSGALDTLETSNNLIRIRKDYIITSFDSGLYYIPPVKILAGSDTVESNEMVLKIATYDVDTANVKIFDIKGVQKAPFVLSDYVLTLLLLLFIWVLALLIIWLILKKKYGKEKEIKTAEQLLPPHVVAIMELDRLKSEKIWKVGKNKEYYTILSDILRKYIERRFNINALELTTDEILVLFKRDRSTQSVYQNLRQILQLADLVKFAKIQPLENENEMSIMNSYLFVNQTKIEEIIAPEEIQEELHTVNKVDAQTESVSSDEDVMKKYQPK